MPPAEFQFAPQSVPDLSRGLRPGDSIVWGQAGGKPEALTRALVAQRADFSPLIANIGFSLSNTILPEHTDHLCVRSYCASVIITTNLSF